MAKQRVPRTEGEIQRHMTFLDQFKYSAEMYWASYCDWNRGDNLERNYWSTRSGFGGTYTMRAIMWFQHIHRPGSKVYRPSVIMRNLRREALSNSW
jgi:hypothetical protein